MSFDADAVESVFDGVSERVLRVLRFKRGVGEDRGEHRRHVGADHRGALAHGGKANRRAAGKRRFARNDLELRVGRLNRRRGFDEIVVGRTERFAR